MKKLILGVALLFSFGAMAELEPMSDYEMSQFELSAEGATLECDEDEVLERVLVGRYCVVRNPQYHYCEVWENLYRERCVPKTDN